MSRRNPALRTSHLRDIRRKHLLFRTLSFVFVLILVVIGSIYILRIDKLNISDIKIAGAVAIDGEEVKSVVGSILSQSYIYIIPKRSVLFYPGSDIEEVVLEAFPRIQSMDIFLNGQTLVVNLVERKPDALWCGDGSDKNPQCFYVDDTGLAYAEAPAFSGSVFVHYFVGVGTTTIPFSVMSQDQYRSIRSFIAGLDDTISNTSAVYIDTNSDVFFELSNGLEVRVVLSSDMSKTFSNIQAVLRDDKLKKTIVKNPTDLKYLDLRFGNKVFYR